jgi:hypothetical protein
LIVSYLGAFDSPLFGGKKEEGLAGKDFLADWKYRLNCFVSINIDQINYGLAFCLCGYLLVIPMFLD